MECTGHNVFQGRVPEGLKRCVRTEKKPQISPLRCAPVEMTNLLHGDCQLSSGCMSVHGPTNLSSRPERTRISCLAALDTPPCAAFVKESRMKFTNATKLNRKFGVAQWRACPGVPWDRGFFSVL